MLLLRHHLRTRALLSGSFVLFLWGLCVRKGRTPLGAAARDGWAAAFFPKL
jgi:hypothetical protein